MLRPVPLSEKGDLHTRFEAYRRDYYDLVHPGEALEPYPWFDGYWTEPDRHPYWITAGDEVAGFVLVNGWAESGLPLDQAIGEFCILPDHRRHGLGLKAVVALMALHTGQWELKVHHANLPGMAFWPRALAAAGAKNPSQIEGSDSLILRFQTP